MAIIKTLWPLVKGLKFTISQALFTKPVTYQYPEQRREVSERWRGLHRLKSQDGTLNCVACGLCEAVCPADVITVEAQETPDGRRFPSRFDVEVTRCIFCGYCQEACPKDAIELTGNYDFCEYTREDFALSRDVLARN